MSGERKVARWDAPDADPSLIGAGAEFREDEPGVRFGDRLRKLRANLGPPRDPYTSLYEMLGTIAAAIDKDAASLREEVELNSRTVRGLVHRQVEGAVERLKATFGTGRDMLDVEEFNCELGRIFGERQDQDEQRDRIGMIRMFLGMVADKSGVLLREGWEADDTSMHFCLAEARALLDQISPIARSGE